MTQKDTLLKVAATDYTDLSRTSLVFSFSIVSSLFFLWGLSYGLLDVLNQHFLDIFHLTKVQTTLLQFAYFVAYLVAGPPMGMFMRKYGYKTGIHVGLGLFSIGAVLFWPSAKFGKYGMFVAFTFVAASGLATLEVAANSYIVVLGSPKHAAFRLTLAQGFNGIATVVGPIIAAHTFFNGKNATSLHTVQYVYLALACFALLLNILLAFAKLPEIRQAVTAEQEDQALSEGWRGFLKQKHTIFGFAAEFFYVGAQVAVASMFMFYVTEQKGINPPISKSMGSNLFSVAQAVFTVGRFIGVVYLRFIDPAFALFVHGVFLLIFCAAASFTDGRAGIGCLMIVFLFESICYPVIFSVATANLGPWAKVGGGLIAAGVSGGAAWPSAQAALADSKGTRTSYMVAFIGFVPLMLYGLGMWVQKCQRHGTYSILVKNLDGADECMIEQDIQQRRYSEAHPDALKQELSHDDRV